MALVFGAGVGDLVNCGSGSSLGNIGPFTALAWIYMTSAADATQRKIMQKGLTTAATTFLFITSTGDPVSGGLACAIGRGTSNNIAYGASSISVNVPLFVVATWTGNITDTPRLYMGIGTLPITELSYNGSTSVGSGTTRDDSAATLIIGNRSSGSNVFKGNIGPCAIYSGTILTIPEMELVRQGSLPKFNLCVFAVNMTDLFTRDLSYKSNNGTITGATLLGGPTNFTQGNYLIGGEHFEFNDPYQRQGLPLALSAVVGFGNPGNRGSVPYRRKIVLPRWTDLINHG